MIQFDWKTLSIVVSIHPALGRTWYGFWRRNLLNILLLALSIISVLSFWLYYQNGLGLAYNDARSHLNIGRRVVEGLTPGAAQLGSVWLPLPHILMIPTIWHDWFWHSGMAGAVQSMLAFVATGYIIYHLLKELKVELLGRLVGVLVFVLNLNVLYMQSIAMTELLLLAMMTAGVYELVKWHRREQVSSLILAAFWIMLSTLIRYDGWFLLAVSGLLVVRHTLISQGYKVSEGTALFFGTLAGFGVLLWFGWNLLIFKDPLYFAYGPFSAHAQQQQLEAAGVLETKHNLGLATKMYWYALAYNSYPIVAVLGLIGLGLLLFDSTLKREVRWGISALLAPLFFNILALYLGHSVLFVQGISGNTWFNIRYGLMMMPSLAVAIGYIVHRFRPLRLVIVGLLAFSLFFAFSNADAVTIDDGKVGSSQKNVSEVSTWLRIHAGPKDGFILISAASHDAIVFSSGLPMTRFIHEGTGDYWLEATSFPDKWARWIVMRTHDDNDLTFRLVKKTKGFEFFEKVQSFPFADIYQLKPEYESQLPAMKTLIESQQR